MPRRVELASPPGVDPLATASLRTLLRHTALPAKEIVAESLHIAGELCIYTNDQIHLVELP